MWTEVFGIIAGTAGAVGTYAGVRYTGKQARAAAAVTRAEDKAAVVSHDDVERRRDAIDGYEALSKNLFDRIASQDKRIAEIEQRQAETERELWETQRSLNAAVTYIERLLDFIAVKIPGSSPDVPPMPAAVREHMRNTTSMTDTHGR